MTARQPSRYHSAQQQISVPLLCGSSSNFTSAYSPLRHHLEGTATCGKKSLTAKQPLASAPRAALNPLHRDTLATSSLAARAACSSAASREPLRGSSSRTSTRATSLPALPSTRRDTRCANNKSSARPCFRSCEPCPH